MILKNKIFNNLIKNGIWSEKIIVSLSIETTISYGHDI